MKKMNFVLVGKIPGRQVQVGSFTVWSMILIFSDHHPMQLIKILQ